MALSLRLPLQSASLAVLASMLFGIPAAAQDPAGDPLAQAQAFFDDLAAMRWQAAALRFHPDAAERIRRAHIEAFRGMEAARQREPMYEPTIPAAVRAWFEQRRRAAEEDYRAEDRFVPPSELEDVDAFEALARILARTDMRTQMLLALERRREALPPGVHLEDELSFRKQAFAVAPGGDSVAYVLYRTLYSGHEIAPELPPEIATLRRTVDGWRVWSPGENGAIGSASFLVAEIPTWADLAERLEKLRDRVFAWPIDGPAELTVRIVGFTPGAAPRGIELEGVQADGTTSRFVVPFDALEALVEYLQPWLYVR
jgi:hypothetical protein